VNDLYGLQQKLLDAAGITASGTPDTVLASQYYEAIRRTAGFPGLIVALGINSDPATLGLRILLLQGQGIVAANYVDLVTACYVGDVNNATVGAAGGGYYKSSDAGGATPDTAGPYFQLPDSRGYFPRGLDVAGTVDPQGASRYLGDNQSAKTWNHVHQFSTTQGTKTGFQEINVLDTAQGTPGDKMVSSNTGTDFKITDNLEPLGIGDDDETRPSNFSVNWGIWY
jgi:hypothetical protein